MRRAWKAVIAVSAVAVLVALTAAAAQPVAGALEDRPLLKCFAENVGRFFSLLKSLDLTSEQKAKVAEIRSRHKAEISTALHRLNDAHRKLVTAVRADAPSEAAIRAAAGELGAAIADGAVLRSKIRQEALPILTPAQRQKIDTAISEAQASVDKALQEFDAK